MSRVDFMHQLKSPHSAPRLQTPMRIELHPHFMGGYLVQVSPVGEWGASTLEGFATATSLRDLAASFTRAAEVLDGYAANPPAWWPK